MCEKERLIIKDGSFDYRQKETEETIEIKSRNIQEITILTREEFGDY